MADGLTIVASGSAVLGDGTLAWLMRHPRKMLTSAAGAPLAIAVPADEQATAESAFADDQSLYPSINCVSGPELFNRKLRRREKLFAYNLDEHAPIRVERLLFDSVYKGVTDLVTKWVWPWPAFWVTRTLARFGVSPNFVTIIGILLVFAAAYFFWEGKMALGLAAAWLMTFLDTVDGKLARVTATSSKLGNALDHGTDLIHPPVWWVCMAVGLTSVDALSDRTSALAAGVIVLSYLVGRAIEGVFKSSLGFNQYIWRPLDTHFRLVVARRNSILAILTVGLLLDAMAEAYYAAAVWSVASVLIQLVRFAQARSRQPIEPWLMRDS